MIILPLPSPIGSLLGKNIDKLCIGFWAGIKFFTIVNPIRIQSFLESQRVPGLLNARFYGEDIAKITASTELISYGVGLVAGFALTTGVRYLAKKYTPHYQQEVNFAIILFTIFCTVNLLFSTTLTPLFTIALCSSLLFSLRDAKRSLVYLSAHYNSLF